MVSRIQNESEVIVERLRSIDRTLNYMMALAILWFGVWLITVLR